MRRIAPRSTVWAEGRSRAWFGQFDDFEPDAVVCGSLSGILPCISSIGGDADLGALLALDPVITGPRLALGRGVQRVAVDASPSLLELCEEAFDAPALPIDNAMVLIRVMTTWQDDRLAGFIEHHLMDGVQLGIEAAAGAAEGLGFNAPFYATHRWPGPEHG